MRRYLVAATVTCALLLATSCGRDAAGPPRALPGQFAVVPNFGTLQGGIVEIARGRFVLTRIPGGAVGIDKLQNGYISDVVFGTLYGDIWKLDATTGANSYGTEPLFRYTADGHPLGAPLTIYSNGGQLFGLGVPGGYADLAATTLWSANDQKAVAVWLDTPVANAPLDENSGAPYVPWTYDLVAGDKSFSQAVIVGGEVFFTADSTDINANGVGGYGSDGADTGRVYRMNVADGSAATTVVVRGGASSIQTDDGNTVYNSSKDKAQQLSINATDSTAGESVGSPDTGRVTRLLWLRTL